MKKTRMKFASAISLCALVIVGRPASAQESDPARFLSMVESYLTLLDHMREMSSDPRSALMLAQHSMKEIYEKKGQKVQAVPELRKVLEGVEDPPVRTAVRFTISDIYKETGQLDRALEELRIIVSENKVQLAKKK